jgi:nitronate monooxygenase
LQNWVDQGFHRELARGIHNELLTELNRSEVEIRSYPLQRFLVRNLAFRAEKSANPELLPLWAGQSASLPRKSDADALGVERFLNRFSGS